MVIVATSHCDQVISDKDTDMKMSDMAPIDPIHAGEALELDLIEGFERTQNKLAVAIELDAITPLQSA